MNIWRIDDFFRGRNRSALLHVHPDGYECPCTREDSVASCIGCSATVKIFLPLDELPDLGTAMKEQLPVTGVILTRPLSRHDLIRLASKKTARAVAAETHLMPTRHLPEEPLFLAA